MERFKLQNRLKDFAQYLGLDIKKGFLDDYQLDVFYKHFKHIDPKLFEKAMTIMEETYNPGRYRKMPVVEDIMQAVKDAQGQGRAGLEADMPDGCSRCNMTGFVHVDGHLFKTCNCLRGQKIDQNFKMYKRRKK